MLNRAARSTVTAVALALAAGAVGVPALADPPVNAELPRVAGRPTVGLVGDRDYPAAVSRPKEDSYYPAHGGSSIDALHYALDLTWLPRQRVLDGVATITFRAPRLTRLIQLDLGDPLHVRRVLLDGSAAPFSHDGKDLTVVGGFLADSQHTLRITYRGTPEPVKAPTTRSDIERLGWTTTASGQVWTMQEPFGAFTWYPVNDQPADKAYYDARIDVPKRWIGVFNGELVRRRTTAQRTITNFSLHSPASSYLTTIAIGPYHRLRDTGPHRLPITYWVPDTEARYVRWLRQTPRMLSWLESRLGRYPFDRIGVVVVPSRSAMETQTLITFGLGRLRYGWDARAVLLHELAHQWYGDTVTPRDWRDLWLNEGFAMYLQFRWDASHGGRPMSFTIDYLRDVDQRLRRTYGPPGDYDRRQFASTNVYYCTALMLHELRAKIGREEFARLLRAWPSQHELSNQSRRSYLDWLNDQTGRRLGPFVREWLMSPTTPT